MEISIDAFFFFSRKMIREIPSSSIITSRLSRVDIQDIIKIVYSLKEIKGEQEINARTRQKQYILGVGISNNEELNQLKYIREMPIIHVQKECQSIIQLERTKTKSENFRNRFYFQLCQPILWIFYGIKMKQLLNHLKQGKEAVDYRLFRKSTIPIPNYAIVLFTLSTTTLLSYVTKKLITYSRKKQYQFIERNNEFFLIRNDVFYGKWHYYWYYFVFPYSFLGALWHYQTKYHASSQEKMVLKV